MNAKNRRNKLFLVGAGPGSPLSISVEALGHLEKSDVVIVDGDAESGLKPYLAGKEVVIVHGDWVKRSALAVRHLRRGKNVCCVSYGNPFLFGEGPALTRACDKAGFSCVVSCAQSSLDQLFCMLRMGCNGARGFYVATFHSVTAGVALNPAAPVFLMCLDTALRNPVNARRLRRSLLAYYKPSRKIEALNASGFRAAFRLDEFVDFCPKIPLQSSLYIPGAGRKNP